MYYHCRPLKYVCYGKVLPPPEETIDWLLPAYKWLGHHCGYCPQIWLSRSRSDMTGFRNSRLLKKQKRVIASRSENKISNDSVLFGFDIIKGFPLHFEHWNIILNAVLYSGDNFQKQNEEIVKAYDRYVGYCKEDNEKPYRELQDWLDSGRDLDGFLRKYVFEKKDQVVVPSLNLKSAKKIICQNEKQKKKLRKMGFIEDRLIIKNFKKYDW